MLMVGGVRDSKSKKRRERSTQPHKTAETESRPRKKRPGRKRRAMRETSVVCLVLAQQGLFEQNAGTAPCAVYRIYPALGVYHREPKDNSKVRKSGVVLVVVAFRVCEIGHLWCTSIYLACCAAPPAVGSEPKPQATRESVLKSLNGHF